MSYAQELAIARRERLARMSEPLSRVESVGETRLTAPPPISNAMMRQANALLSPSYPSMKMIREAVCSHYNIASNEFASSRKAKRLTFPRQVAMYFCWKLTPCTSWQIAKFLGRDHTTVLYGAKKIDTLRKIDMDTNAHLIEIESMLGVVVQ